MVHVLPLGKLHIHFKFCQIDQMLISANEVSEFKIEIHLLSCDDAGGGASSTLTLATPARSTSACPVPDTGTA